MKTLFDFIFCFISFIVLSFLGLVIIWILDCLVNLSLLCFPFLCDFTWGGFRIFLAIAIVASILGTIEINVK